MASAMLKVEKIRQIVHLMQAVKRWKSISRRRRRRPAVLSYTPNSDSDSASSYPPSGFFSVYVGAERRRFVIPTRFLNQPIFLALLKKAEEEFGFQTPGGLLVLPCEVGFFEGVLRILEEDEQRFRCRQLDEVLELFNELGFDSSSCCKESTGSCHLFAPLLPKARV